MVTTRNPFVYKMFLMRNEKLIQFILEEMKIQDINRAELARRSGLSKPTISKLLNGQTPYPTNVTLQGIAHGLGKPESVIFNLVSDSPPQANYSPIKEEIIHKLDNLSEDEQIGVSAYIDMRIALKERQGEANATEIRQAE